MILKGVLDQQFMEGDQHYVESAKGFFYGDTMLIIQ